MRASVIALLLVGAAGCGGSSSQQDAGADANDHAQDVGPEDRPRAHPDVPPVPGFTVTVDGVPWYVLNGSITYGAGETLVYISAMVSCDQCADVSQIVISLGSPATDACGPSDDTISFTRSSITSHAWRSATGQGCGFQVSEAGGDTSVRAVGSFQGVLTNIDTSINLTYTVGVTFDLAIGVHFP